MAKLRPRRELDTHSAGMEHTAPRFSCHLKLILSYLLLSIPVLFFGHEANAYDFVPERHEWASWPGYCKARYVTTNIGERSPFSETVSPQSVQYWREAIGQDTFLHIHHYCAGIIWLERARRSSNERPRGFLLNKAVAESEYTLKSVGFDNPMAPSIVSTMAIAYLEQENNAAAENLIQRLIAKQPTSSDPYVAGAIVYYRVGKIATALEVMEEGLKNIEKPTAEFYYNFGLILVKLERYSEAKEYADLAYDLGYPLPGLQQKLKAQGID